jgi:erythrin-vacuolar iron transport family protein
MGKEYSLQEALKMAVKSEKDSHDFYRKAGSIAKNERAKKVFDLLASEEIDHLNAFFHHYHGGDLGTVEQYLASPPDLRNATFLALEKACNDGMDEQAALEIALKEEKATIDQYTMFARDIIDPLVKGIFEKVIRETQKHYDLIESEYAHVMTMVHESDQNIYVRE